MIQELQHQATSQTLPVLMCICIATMIIVASSLVGRPPSVVKLCYVGGLNVHGTLISKYYQQYVMWY